MRDLPQSDATLLIRTDFTDEAAWQDLRTAVTTPADEDDDFLAMLHIVDDPAYRDVTAEQIVSLAPAEDDLLILADRTAMTGAEMPLLAVYMGVEDEEEDEDGQGEGDATAEGDGGAAPGFDELRVIASELWSVENNISLANMDWEEFVDAAEEDGVFRGF
ncbi:DUF6924 domain-containing protein [Streptomyces sp. NPDC060184]|uniref:DUF6924 domain-containing protein n=1 Tax=Streptomyces sp. NPDC060184 TaxID=3347064 RepID=UPI00365CC311